jgi:hypothetical protein
MLPTAAFAQRYLPLVSGLSEPNRLGGPAIIESVRLDQAWYQNSRHSIPDDYVFMYDESLEWRFLKIYFGPMETKWSERSRKTC